VLLLYFCLRNGCKCELSVSLLLLARAETPGFEIETADASSTETTTLELLLTTWWRCGLCLVGRRLRRWLDTRVMLHRSSSFQMGNISFLEAETNWWRCGREWNFVVLLHFALFFICVISIVHNFNKKLSWPVVSLLEIVNVSYLLFHLVNIFKKKEKKWNT
jgi:hypothetical protein